MGPAGAPPILRAEENRTRPVVGAANALEFAPALGGIADMAGRDAGSTRSKMTQSRQMAGAMSPFVQFSQHY